MDPNSFQERQNYKYESFVENPPISNASSHISRMSY